MEIKSLRRSLCKSIMQPTAKIISYINTRLEVRSRVAQNENLRVRVVKGYDTGR
jgi:hypothetical protein